MNRHLAASFLIAVVSVSTGCASVPDHLDLSMKHASVHNTFVAELEPPSTPAAINKIHSWQVRLTDAAGQPIAHAHIDVDGGMPQHGHGLPTQPRVTRELSDGTYLIEGMKFSMSGWWEIRLKIDAAGVSDTVTFNTVVGTSTASR